MWFTDLSFAPLIPAQSFTDIKSAMEYANNITVIPNVTTFEHLIINTDATIGQDHHKITTYGFENLCKILGIPKPFARMIPNDLLFENIRRLRQDNLGTEIAILSRENGEIASIVKAPYKEPSYGDLLGLLAARKDVRYIDLGEQYLTAGIAFEDMKLKAEYEEDELFVASFIQSSIVKESPLRSVSGFIKSKDSVNFIYPAMGTSRANYKEEDTTLLLAKFGDGIRCYNFQTVEAIGKGLNAFGKYRFSEAELVGVWRNLSNILYKSLADEIIGFTEEERKIVVKNVTKLKKENRDAALAGGVLKDSINSLFDAFDTLFKISSHATEKTHESVRFRIEKLAGNWFSNLILSHTSHDKIN